FDAAAIVAANACGARVRRVARLLRPLAKCATSIERALADHLTSLSRAGEAEPGLFDRRVLVSFERDRAEVAEIQQRTGERMVRYDDGATVSVGAPQLVFIFRQTR